MDNDKRKSQSQMPHSEFLYGKFADSELVIGLVGAVGTDLKIICDILKERLVSCHYNVEEIRISKDVIPLIKTIPKFKAAEEFKRIGYLMDVGDNVRRDSSDNSILVLGAAAKISGNRPPQVGETPPYKKRHAYIINSLKHSNEVVRLREIYSDGFVLLGVYSDEVKRLKNLKKKGMTEIEATHLIKRDDLEKTSYGQQTSKTFHLSDFFIHVDEDFDKTKNSIKRVMDIFFGHPYKTPTFDEHAMFMAFSAALRSADLSRQVGAVVTKEEEVLSVGANDCPRFGGGLYWPQFDNKDSEVKDALEGRDYMKGSDSNEMEKKKIIEKMLTKFDKMGIDKDKVLSAIDESGIDDITEYGRVVHAEMEALLSCARKNVSPVGGTIYCTTFPCHNCAKHIVAAGIKRVVYIEPYPKSKALELHPDSIKFDFYKRDETKVCFEPFVGVGPRKFFDLFTMNLGSGYPIERKHKKGPKEGQIVDWKIGTSKMRMQMSPSSYLDREKLASRVFNGYRKEMMRDEKGAKSK